MFIDNYWETTASADPQNLLIGKAEPSGNTINGRPEEGRGAFAPPGFLKIKHDLLALLIRQYFILELSSRLIKKLLHC